MDTKRPFAFAISLLIIGIILISGSNLAQAQTVTVYEESSPNIAYTGSWGTWAQWQGGSQYSGGFAKANGQYLGGGSATFTFTGTGVAWFSNATGIPYSGTGVAKVYLDGALVATVDLRTFTWTGPSQAVYTATGLADTSHTLKVENKPFSSGYYTWYQWILIDKFEVTAPPTDTTPPVVVEGSIIVLPNPTAIDPTVTAVIVDEASDVVSAEYFLDTLTEPNVEIRGVEMVLGAGTLQRTATAVIPISGLADGAHTISVRGKDSANNWGQTRSAQFIISSDKTPPDIKIKSPKADHLAKEYKLNDIIKVSFTVTEDKTGIASVKVSFDGTDFPIVDICPPIESGAKSFDCEFKIPAKRFGVGSHRLTIDARNTVGLTSKETVSFIVSSTDAIISGPLTICAGEIVTYNFIPSDAAPEGIVRFEAKELGGIVELTGTPTAYSVTVKGIGEGGFWIRARYINNAGKDAVTDKLFANVGDNLKTRLVIHLVEGIKPDGTIVDGTKRDDSNARDVIDKANNIWKQGCIDFLIVGMQTNYVDAKNIKIETVKELNNFIFSVGRVNDAINLYFVQNLDFDNVQGWTEGHCNPKPFPIIGGNPLGVAVEDITIPPFSEGDINTAGQITAHELGHALGITQHSDILGNLMYQISDELNTELNEFQIEKARKCAEKHFLVK